MSQSVPSYPYFLEVHLDMIVPGMSGLRSGIFPLYITALIMHSFPTFATCAILPHFQLDCPHNVAKEYKL
jgi:hypothetical protein